MNNYNFEKRLYKNGINYCLELDLPNNFNNFFYKIYGNDGFYTYGKYSCYKNNNSNNTLLVNINNLQILFVSIILNKKNTEYYDFIDMTLLIKNIDEIKNIKLKIERNIEKNITPFNCIQSIDNEDDELSSSSDDENIKIERNITSIKPINNEDNESSSSSDDEMSDTSLSDYISESTIKD
jgi:hypothetical protein